MTMFNRLETKNTTSIMRCPGNERSLLYTGQFKEEFTTFHYQDIKGTIETPEPRTYSESFLSRLRVPCHVLQYLVMCVFHEVTKWGHQPSLLCINHPADARVKVTGRGVKVNQVIDVWSCRGYLGQHIRQIQPLRNVSLERSNKHLH